MAFESLGHKKCCYNITWCYADGCLVNTWGDCGHLLLHYSIVYGLYNQSPAMIFSSWWFEMILLIDWGGLVTWERECGGNGGTGFLMAVCLWLCEGWGHWHWSVQHWCEHMHLYSIDVSICNCTTLSEHMYLYSIDVSILCICDQNDIDASMWCVHWIHTRKILWSLGQLGDMYVHMCSTCMCSVHDAGEMTTYVRSSSIMEHVGMEGGSGQAGLAKYSG